MKKTRFPVPVNIYRTFDFGDRLESVLMKSSHSPSEWAREIGVHRETMRRWRLGDRMPDGINVRAIVIAARKFGCTNITTDWILSMCEYELKFTEDF